MEVVVAAAVTVIVAFKAIIRTIADFVVAVDTTATVGIDPMCYEAHRSYSYANCSDRETSYPTRLLPTFG